MTYIRTPDGNGTYNEIDFVYKPSYDIDTYCGTVTEPVASYDFALYEIVGGGETVEQSSPNFTDTDFITIGNYLPNATSTINYTATVSQDIYYVSALCRYENEPTSFDFIKNGDYYIYAQDIELDFTSPFYNRIFSIEPAQAASNGSAITFISSGDSDLFLQNAQAGTVATFQGFSFIIAVIIGIVIVIGFTKWLIDNFEKSYQNTLDKAVKRSKETRDLLNK